MSFAVEHVSELADRVAAAGTVRWLVEGLWIDLQYGAFGGSEKTQKTFTAYDLSVSAASGTSFLNHFRVEATGSVMVYAGEGGERSVVRRLRAICESRGLILEELPIHVRARAPHLNDDEHMAQVVEDVARLSPVLVVLDPYYLSASGSDTRDLVGQGQLLERPQIICEEAGSSLLVIHHFNQGEGLDTRRFSGTGIAQWARVLGMFEVTYERTDPETQASDVTIAARFVGGEIPTLNFTIKRHIAADNPKDPNSPLSYSVEVFSHEPRQADDGMSPARRKVLEALTAVGGTVKAMGDWIATTYGQGLKYETIKRELANLAKAGLADSYGDGWSAEWFLAAGEAAA